MREGATCWWLNSAGAHAQGVEDDSLAGALQDYAEFVENALDKVLRLSQFRHVELVTVETDEEVPEVSWAKHKKIDPQPRVLRRLQAGALRARQLPLYNHGLRYRLCRSVTLRCLRASEAWLAQPQLTRAWRSLFCKGLAFRWPRAVPVASHCKHNCVGWPIGAEAARNECGASCRMRPLRSAWPSPTLSLRRMASAPSLIFPTSLISRT